MFGIKIINTDLEEKNKEKEERKDNIYNKEEFAMKYNNIKNPLIQTNSKSSISNSQSIPEIINNPGFQKQKNENKAIENECIFNKNEFKIIRDDLFQNNNNKINYHFKNDKEKNLNIKEKIDKNLLLLLKPNKLNFKKKLNNFSTLNLHKRPITSLISQNSINKNQNFIKEAEDNNKLNKSKNLSKIKLKPLIPLIRSITPFKDNSKKTDVINDKNKLKYNFSNVKLRNVNDNVNETNNTSNINNDNVSNSNHKKIDKKMFMRKLNFDKNKFNLQSNLSQIKTKFTNFIKPNFKNVEITNFKTEI